MLLRRGKEKHIITSADGRDKMFEKSSEAKKNLQRKDMNMNSIENPKNSNQI